MTVKQLRDLLQHLPDDAYVLVPSHDHSYRRADVAVGPVVLAPRHVTRFSEYHPSVELREGETVVQALVVT